MELCSLQVLVLLIFLLTLCWCSQECHWNGRYLRNRCHCYDGFTGTNCETDCHCESHGVCKADGTCECETGWKWSASQHKCVWDCSCHGGVQCIGPGECGCVHTCKWGACRNGQCVCYEGYKGDDCSIYDKNIMLNKDVRVGVNVRHITYYSSELKWVDLAKQSMEWKTQRYPSNMDTKEIDKIQLRKDGYPASYPAGLNVATDVYVGFGEHMPGGNYTVLYDGEGTVDVKHSKIHYESKGRIVMEFQQPGHYGIEIKISETNPHNPLHNLRFLAPGYENTYQRFPFHPLFLEFLKRFSEIRFMDFLFTNGHEGPEFIEGGSDVYVQPEPTTWNTRKLPDYYTQTGHDGGAVEYLVQLVNWVGVDAWVNMPHAADDNYITQFATYVKRHLRPDLKVYVEYSNEVWNTHFRQNQYAKEKGQALYPTDDPTVAGMKYFVKRATELADIWSSVWTGSDRNRLVNVVGGKTGRQNEYDQFIQVLGSNKAKFDALTVTGYFLCGKVAFSHTAEFINMSMAEVAQHCDQGLAKQKQTYQHYMDVAKAQGMKLVMYEGGPLILAGATQDFHAVTDKAIAFNEDPHIQQPAQDILNAWYDVVTTNGSNPSPGGLFNYFSSTSTPGKYGSWGMAEYTGQDLSKVPKWLAVQTFISDHWPNTLLGPKCSFAQDQTISTAFGCFPSGGHYVCAKSADNGHSWTNLPSLHQSNKDHVTLDGYDVKEKKLYARVTDRTYVNTYHVYNDHTQQWTTIPNFQYFADEYASTVSPRIPAGGDRGVSGHLNC